MSKGFKLIAIRPLKGCNIKLLKVLKEDYYYYFYSDYKIINNSISYTQTIPHNLYKSGNLNVNISAVVGKNGSGKSALLELLFAAIYQIGLDQNLIENEPKDGCENVKVNIYYSIDDVYYEAEINNSHFNISPLTGLNQNQDKKLITDRRFKIKKLISKINSEKETSDLAMDFFYSIAVNYSHYALNSRDLGIWIKKLFHKNDGYQTPVVINPMRTEGNININSENHLVRSRLLSNILSYLSEDELQDSKNTLRCLIGNKVVKKLVLKLDETKFAHSVSDNESENNNLLTVHSDRYASEDMWNAIKEVFNISEEFNSGFYFAMAKDYIFNKLENIASKYEDYNFFIKKEGNNNLLKRDVFKKYLLSLLDDQSHVTFKLRQALNFIKYDYYKLYISETPVNINEIANRLNIIDEELIYIVPPSFLKVDILFSDDTNNSLNNLSSGEKQKIHANSSIIYHLRNIESAYLNKKTNKQRPLKFNNINLIFDEIELYYHPELQRTFIHDLLENLKKAQFKVAFNINCIFSTHSPFILSDIPEANCMFLEVDENGNAVQRSVEELNGIKTFGANIHDLLRNGFFMKNGTIGKTVKNTIESIADEILEKKPISDSRGVELFNLIRLIGEPVLKERLEFLLHERLGSKTKDEIIKELQEENLKLKEKR